jgi:putative transcriptional regulator
MDKPPRRKRPSAKLEAASDQSPAVDPVPAIAPVRATPRRRSPALAEPPERRLTATTSRVTEPGFYSPAELRALRESLGASQSVFAGLVGVSKSLVEHWEGGIRVPSAMARRLLDAIAADPRRFLRELTEPRARRQGGGA